MSTRRLGLAGLAGAAALVAAVTVASRVVGFGRWLVQSFAVGANAVGEAYATANTLPNILFEVVAGGALAGAVVPLLAGPFARGLRTDVDRIASALLSWAVVVLAPVAAVLALVGWLVPEAITVLMPADAAGAAGEAQVRLAATLLVMFAPQVLLYGVGVVLMGILQAQHRFLWAAAAPLASSLVVMVSYLLFRASADGLQDHPSALPPEAVMWLGWGTTAGVAALSLPLLLPVWRSGVRLRWTLSFPAGVAARARRLALSGLGGLVAQQLAILATLTLANRYGSTGTWNVFQYSQAVYFLPYAVLAVPLSTVVFPRLAERAATGDSRGYARLVSASTRTVLVVSAAGAAALVAAAPAVAAVFRAIDAGDVSGMGTTLTLIAPGLLGYALIFQLSRVLYALERARAAVVAVSIGWGAVVVASAVAVLLLVAGPHDRGGTLQGLALGTAVGMTVAGAALLTMVRRAAGPVALRGLGRTLVVVLVGGALGAVAGRWVTAALLGDGGVAAAIGTGTLGAAAACGAVGLVVAVVDRPLLRALRSRVSGTAPGRSGQVDDRVEEVP